MKKKKKIKTLHPNDYPDSYVNYNNCKRSIYSNRKLVISKKVTSPIFSESQIRNIDGAFVFPCIPEYRYFVSTVNY